MRMSLCSGGIFFFFFLWYYYEVEVLFRCSDSRSNRLVAGNSVADSDTHPLKSVSVQIAAIEDMVYIDLQSKSSRDWMHFDKGHAAGQIGYQLFSGPRKKSSLLLTQFRTRTFIDINLAERFHNLQSPSIGKIKRSITRSVDENGIQFGLVCSINLFDVVTEEQNLLGLPLYRW